MSYEGSVAFQALVPTPDLKPRGRRRLSTSAAVTRLRTGIGCNASATPFQLE
jgi:hypothetical protein